MKEVDRIAAAVLAASRVNARPGEHDVAEYMAEYDAFVREFEAREEKKRDESRAESEATWEPLG